MRYTAAPHAPYMEMAPALPGIAVLEQRLMPCTMDLHEITLPEKPGNKPVYCRLPHLGQH